MARFSANSRNDFINGLLPLKSPSDSSVSAILDYVKEQDESFILGTQTEVILILGITGAGKSTLTLFLTNGNLEAVPIEGVKGGFRIIDPNDKISDVSTITSKTIVPNLFTDEENGLAYYDCPGFIDSRGVKVDIAATFSIRKLLNFAESTKFVFTVSYSSIQVAIGDRHEFMDLVGFATGLIKNVDKYRNAIALVVTKVPYKFDFESDIPTLIDDASMIESIATFLKQTKTDLQKKLNETQSTNDRQAIADKLLFIEILLERKADKYTRISIFRLANKPGSLSKIPLIQNEKIAIYEMINDNLQYIQKEAGDFGFVISANSQNQVNDLIDEIRSQLITDFASINSELKLFFKQKEHQFSHSLRASIDATEKISHQLSRINSMEPLVFRSQFIDTIDELRISIMSSNFRSFLQSTELLEFLQTFSKRKLTIPTEIMNDITNLKAYLSNSQAWYSFLIDLRERLSAYSTQQSNEIDGTKLMNLKINVERVELMVNDLDIKSTLDQLSPNIYTSIQHLFVNTFKVKLLQSVWGQSMQKLTHNCQNGTHLVVKGFNVLLSDVFQLDCFGTAKYVEIFAANKVFIDIDIDATKSSQYVAIVAPVWNIVVNKRNSKRIINLSGRNGEAMEKARPSVDFPNNNDDRSVLTYTRRGEHGKPGELGGPAGQFFAIGHLSDESRVEIIIKGGNGGRGQDGGDGLYQFVSFFSDFISNSFDFFDLHILNGFFMHAFFINCV